MAEALAILGAISSVLQIVDFTAKLVSHTRELVNSDNDALREVKDTERLAGEYENLAEVILRAKVPSDTSTFEYSNEYVRSRNSIRKYALQCQQEAKTILDLIDELRMTAASSGWKRVAEGSKKALRFLKMKRKLKARLDTLRHTGDALDLALRSAAQDKSEAIVDAITQALWFEDIEQREQIIEDAYPQTYQWALDNESFGIRSWLSSDSSIFWVTGKPGSGKSTLMKFLFTSSRTSAYLREWAQDSKLIIARFYFWYLGSAMQTSTDGLLRSIIYQMIAALPELTRVAFPDHFKAEDKPFCRPKFVYTDLTDALQRLAASAREVKTKKKLCFFIDGLDEFRGDHIELLDLLNGLSRRYEIKLLISSRPWTVFSRAYEGIVPHLRLEDVTKDDIHLYVHNNVRNAVSSTQAFVPSQTLYEYDEIHNLINDVEVKAEGVFLWVYLVVQSIRRGVAEGDSVSVLRRRVQSFPPDLNRFFRELIFDRVDQVYAQQTSQALILAKLCMQLDTKCSGLVSFLDYWLILRSATGFADPQFPYSWEPLTGPMTQNQLKHAAQETRRFLSSVCKDLLIMERPIHLTKATQVTFLHRTVFDFLCTQEMQDLLVARTPECMKSGWVFHLLAWSKLNILQYNSSEDGVAIADAALSTFHPNMSDSVVRELVAYLEQQILSPGWDLSSEAIETLAAFQKNDLIQKCFEFRHCNSLTDCAAHGLLGLSRIREFPIEQVDLLLLSHAVHNSQDTVTVHSPAADDVACSISSWQALLSICHAECKSPSTENDARLERLWDLVEIYIQAKAPIAQIFCTAPIQPGTPHKQVWSKAADFLRACAPPRARPVWVSFPVPKKLAHRPYEGSSDSGSSDSGPDPLDD